MNGTRRDFLRLTSMAAAGWVGAKGAPAAAPGQASMHPVRLDYANATLEDGSVIATPFWRIDSGREGPSLLLIAAQHGHEVKSPDAGIFMTARRRDGSATLGPDDFVEQGQSLGHIIRERDLETTPVLAPVAGYLFTYGFCHGNLCGASLPALHPYATAGDILATIVTV